MGGGRRLKSVALLANRTLTLDGMATRCGNPRSIQRAPPIRRMNIDCSNHLRYSWAVSEERIAHLRKFYSILAGLEEKIGGARTLAICSGRLSWPRRGVYFFMEEGEARTQSGDGPRIVRVGTHALKVNAQTNLWGRLRQHRGDRRKGAGNHRGSIFRLIVGMAVIAQRQYEFPSWGAGNTASAEIRAGETALEREVSEIIGAFPFLWLAIDDEPGAQSLRAYIERNTIALLSNYGREEIDPPSPAWLGRLCDRERVQKSGLWNSDYVDKDYDPAFLNCFEMLALDMERAA